LEKLAGKQQTRMFWKPATAYEFGPFRLDPRERRLLREGQPVTLRPKVFDLLMVLVEHRGHILDKDQMMKLVWPNTNVEEGNIARNISSLRVALGEHRHEHQYIETIPWRGYRFIGEVKKVGVESCEPPINSIAVLPFINVSGDRSLDYLADGIAETVINDLSQLAQLKVMSRNSTFRYKGREIDAVVVGRDLNVQAVVMGRVTAYEDLLSISVELVDARDGSHLWGAQHVRQLTALLAMRETIASEITNQLRVRLTEVDREKLASRHTENSEAYHLFLKGRYHFNKLTLDGVEKGVENFKQAVEKDPHYALAYAGLADCYNYFAKPIEAKQAVSKALELDETLGEAHATLGFFKFVYDWDFAGAENELKQALALSPNYAEAHHWSAIYYANVGRHEEATVEAKRTVELDPLSLMMNMTPALAAYLRRDYQQAVIELSKVIEMEPNFPAAHSVLGSVYVQQGCFEEAMAEYQKVLNLSAGATVVETAIKALMAHACARWGKTDKATKLLDELIRQIEESKRSSSAIPVSLHAIAEIYIALGRIDEAFDWLNKAYDQHDMQMVSLKTNPTLDRLRDDPRFANLVRRVGLPL
jgi:TolB-like protein/Tfp pilus assembly protein PilF